MSDVLKMIMGASGRTPVVIATPSVTSPASGSTATTYAGYDNSFTVVGSSYTQTSGDASPMYSLQAQIATDSGFTSISFDTGESVSTSPSVAIASSLIPEGAFYIRIRYKSASGIWSNWSAGNSFTFKKVYVFTTATNTGSIVVPAGKTSMTARVWGSPSMGLTSRTFSTDGNSGGYVKGTISVTAGESLDIVIGSNNGTGYGGSYLIKNISGGGYSSVSRGVTPLLIAGGAGANTFVTATNAPPTVNSYSYTSGYGGMAGRTGQDGDITLDGSRTYIGSGGGGFEGGANGKHGTNYIIASASSTLNVGAVSNSVTPPNIDTDFNYVGGLPNLGAVALNTTLSTRGLILITFS